MGRRGSSSMGSSPCRNLAKPAVSLGFFLVLANRRVQPAREGGRERWEAGGGQKENVEEARNRPRKPEEENLHRPSRGGSLGSRASDNYTLEPSLERNRDRAASGQEWEE